MKTLSMRADRDAVHVGARLRHARLERRYTLDQVAQLSGMTKGFLSRVERDLTSPSVASLVTLCQVLHIEVGSLFTPPRTALVRSGDAPPVSIGGVGIEQRLLTAQSELSVHLVRTIAPPGGCGGFELYTVDCETEVFYVESGRIEVVIGEETFELGPGDTLSFDGRDPHTWRNTGDIDAVLLFVLVPGGAGGYRELPAVNAPTGAASEGAAS